MIIAIGIMIKNGINGATAFHQEIERVIAEQNFEDRDSNGSDSNPSEDEIDKDTFSLI